MLTSPLPIISKAKWTFLNFLATILCIHSLHEVEWNDAPKSRIHDSVGLLIIKIKASWTSASSKVYIDSFLLLLISILNFLLLALQSCFRWSFFFIIPVDYSTMRSQFSYPSRLRSTTVPFWPCWLLLSLPSVLKAMPEDSPDSLLWISSLRIKSHILSLILTRQTVHYSHICTPTSRERR